MNMKMAVGDKIRDSECVACLGWGEDLWVDDELNVDSQRVREAMSVIGTKNLAAIIAVASSELASRDNLVVLTRSK